MKMDSPVAVILLVAACAPELPAEDGVVTELHVLAVRGEPAEAKPGATVEYTALVAGPGRAAAGVDPAWAFCTAPKPPTENNIVSSSCLQASALVPVGRGPSISAVTPRNACSLFGPDTPTGGFRPRDPDVTGGYYQPLRIDLAGAAPAFHLERIQCELGMAPSDIVTDFAAVYVPNVNPRIVALRASTPGGEIALDAVPPRAHLTFAVSWLPEDVETFAYFDRASQSISTQRESMRVAWYVTAGRLGVATNGRAADDPLAGVTNTWEAPSNASTTALWVVLRDSRGGADFARYELTVPP